MQIIDAEKIEETKNNSRKINTFADYIASFLIKNQGYVLGKQEDYDFNNSLDLKTLFSFLKKTQPRQWNKYESLYGIWAKEEFLKNFNLKVNELGLIKVLRNGLEIAGIKFNLVFYKPKTDLNKKLNKEYSSNIFSIIRKFKYSINCNKFLDLAIFINGIPFIAIEAAAKEFGETINDIKLKLMYEWDPSELCFQFNKRFLSFFALDETEVYKITRINGKQTKFYPFNQGSNGAGNLGGAGNPLNSNGYDTAYFWEKVLAKDLLLVIIQKLLDVRSIEDLEEYGGLEENRTVVFPRYHQIDVVWKLINDIKNEGIGKDYLIQHSSGSGKTFTIVGACYQLESLVDAKNNSVFDSIIVISGKNVFDARLQEIIANFSNNVRIVDLQNTGKSFEQLKEALDSNQKIIVTNIQKFRYIYQYILSNSNKKFAVIIDEANSTQTWNFLQKMQVKKGKDSYKRKTLNAKENTVVQFKNEREFENLSILKENNKAKQKNFSFIVFSAIPEEKTMKMFGVKQLDGSYKPFHTYSERQAIEEGFILNVLDNYIPYEIAHRLAYELGKEKRFKKSKVRSLYKKHRFLNTNDIAKKAILIVETIRENTMQKIGGKGKAMLIVTNRFQAIEYICEIKKYVKLKGYKDFDALVALSDFAFLNNQDFTENINETASGQKISQKQLLTFFHRPEFKLLITTSMLRKEINEPYLHTLFIDKKMTTFQALKSFSKINRKISGKYDTFVLDFINERKITKLYYPNYYEKVYPIENISVAMVYAFRDKIRKYGIFNFEEAKKIYEIYCKDRKEKDLDLKKVAKFYNEALIKYNGLDYYHKNRIKNFCNVFLDAYTYIKEVVQIFDLELEIAFTIIRYMMRVITLNNSENFGAKKSIMLDYCRSEDLFARELLDCDGIFKERKKEKKMQSKQKRNNEIIKNIKENCSLEISPTDIKLITSTTNWIVENENTIEGGLVKICQENNETVFLKSLFPKIFENILLENFLKQNSTNSNLFKQKYFYNLTMAEVGKKIYSELKLKT